MSCCGTVLGARTTPERALGNEATSRLLAGRPPPPPLRTGRERVNAPPPPRRLVPPSASRLRRRPHSTRLARPRTDGGSLAAGPTPRPADAPGAPGAAPAPAAPPPGRRWAVGTHGEPRAPARTRLPRCVRHSACCCSSPTRWTCSLRTEGRNKVRAAAGRVAGQAQRDGVGEGGWPLGHLPGAQRPGPVTLPDSCQSHFTDGETEAPGPNWTKEHLQGGKELARLSHCPLYRHCWGEESNLQGQEASGGRLEGTGLGDSMSGSENIPSIYAEPGGGIERPGLESRCPCLSPVIDPDSPCHLREGSDFGGYSSGEEMSCMSSETRVRRHLFWDDLEDVQPLQEPQCFHLDLLGPLGGQTKVQILNVPGSQSQGPLAFSPRGPVP